MVSRHHRLLEPTALRPESTSTFVTGSPERRSLPMPTRLIAFPVAVLSLLLMTSVAHAQVPSAIELVLQRLDRNNNGILEPEEIQGPMRAYIERLARDNRRINLDRPIRLDRLRRAIERDREQRRQGQGRNQADSRNRTETAVEPLVPGFGVEEDPLPVPGFGAEADFFHVRILEEDIERAERAFRRYDRNRDGYLTPRELQRGRWSDDPMQYDRDGDGRLSLEEMAVRYAHRRLAEDEEEERETRGDSAEQSDDQERRRRGRRRERSDSDEASDERSQDSGDEVESRSYRFTRPTERLPSELPEWFTRLDANQDGQVSMHEFASQWDEDVAAEFVRWDLNGDGIITADEVLRAKEMGVERTTRTDRSDSSPGGTFTSQSGDDSSRQVRGRSFDRR